MPVDPKDLQQNTLWTLEDDFEGISTQNSGRKVPEIAREEHSAGWGAEIVVEERQAQPESEIAFDGECAYTYTGYVLEEGQYRRVTASFTCAEIGVYPQEDPARVRAMVDAVGLDAGRQEEIKRYGKRVWHTPYRPQDAALQGLDYVFRHDVDLVAACYPYALPFYADDAATADRWTEQMYNAYKAFALRGEREALLRLLAEAGISPAALAFDGLREEEAS